VSSFSTFLQTTGERHSTQTVMAAVLAGLLVAAGVLLMLDYDATAGGVFPLALVMAGIMLRWPWVLYAATLAQFSILPIESYFLGFYVPNLTQFLIPALLLAVLAHGVMSRKWGTFRLRTGDVFVGLFIVIAIVGIAVEPGYKNWKTFSNQVLFAIMMYFATRWLDLDRKKFRGTLKWMLIAAGVMLADLVLVQLTGRGGLWTGNRGPLGSLSDQAAYSALFPPLFVYMAATQSGVGAKRRRTWWLVAALVGVVAAAGVKERSGVVAGLAAMFVCIVHPRMFRYIAIGIIALVPIGAWWLSTSVGQEVHSRFADDKDPMLRRRIYVGKAIDYIKSDKWNPVWGTGFWRLKSVSNQMLSQTKLVWDANHQSWRRAYDLGQRPIHCSPVTVFGEYGYGGAFCLLGLLACAVFSVAVAYRRARRKGAVFDSMFLVAMGGSAVGLIINAVFHNTEQVFPVTALVWAFAGLLVGHSDVLTIENDAEEQEEEALEAGTVQIASG